MKYQALIFDLFGTLVYSFSAREYQQVIKKMAGMVSAPPETFWRMWTDTLDETLIGLIPGGEAKIIYICHKLGVPVNQDKVAEAARMFMAYETLNMVIRPGALEVVTALKARGYRIGLISDCSTEGVILWNDTPLAPLFDTAVFSCVSGLRKPDPRIYHLAASQMQVSPERCLYIGDGGSNELTGASNAGMQAVQLRIPDENNTDVYRVGQESWCGKVITSLEEIFFLLEEA